MTLEFMDPEFIGWIKENFGSVSEEDLILIGKKLLEDLDWYEYQNDYENEYQYSF